MSRPAKYAIEDYLETILKIERDGGVPTTTEIARRMGVSPPSVTEMVKRLSREGYTIHKPYRRVTLTDEGRRLANKILRKHYVLKSFLMRELGIPEEEAERAACGMEHHLSDEAEAKLCNMLSLSSEGPPCVLKEEGLCICEEESN